MISGPSADDDSATSFLFPTKTHQTPRKLTAKLSGSDLTFRVVALSGGLLVLVLMILVGSFLAYRGVQALHKAGFSFLTTQDWNPDGGGFGIAAVMVGTILIAFVAIVVAVPLALGTSLYISEYAPQRIQRGLISMVDLMAAVPSVVYGLWGAFFLQWRMTSVSRWINDWFGWIPIFKVNGVTRHETGRPRPSTPPRPSSPARWWR
jgi:phosphate transport system permease protein